LIVLGVDPSTVATGFGLLEGDSRSARRISSGVIRPSRRAPLSDRLKEIHLQLRSLLEQTPPDILVIESTFLHRNVKTALALGQARGVILLAASLTGTPVTEYSASEIKRSAVGYGAASKEQVGLMMTRILGLPNAPAEDEADALAAAWCHLSRAGMPALAGGTH
jgi:crossover junction endodeoxyribonuclease RuvC